MIWGLPGAVDKRKMLAVKTYDNDSVQQDSRQMNRRRRRIVAIPPRPGQLPRILARIYLAAGVLLLMLLVGTVGLRFSAEPTPSLSDAFYMTIITVTTVGYGEVVPADAFGERLFVGLLAISGSGTTTFLFTSLSVFFLETDLDCTLRRRRIKKRIKKLHHHHIVCGFGHARLASGTIGSERRLVRVLHQAASGDGDPGGSPSVGATFARSGVTRIPVFRNHSELAVRAGP